MEPINNVLKPVSDLLPPAVREILEAGGWLAVFGVLLLLLLLVLLVLWRLLFRRRKPKPKRTGSPLDEDLAAYPAPPVSGDRVLTVRRVPVRVRLVVLSQGGKETSLDPNMAGRVVDKVVPGLGRILQVDEPRVLVWPPQPSMQGFPAVFFRHMLRPESEREPSPWVLVAGRAAIGKQWVLVGLALLADEPNELDRIAVEPDRWTDVLRVEKVEEE
jgi:hypothetical protein